MSLHLAAIAVGFLLLVAVTYPLAVFAYESLKNPDKALGLETEDRGGELVFRLVYNVNVTIEDARFEVNLTLDNGTVIQLSDETPKLEPGGTLEVALDKDSLGGHNVTASTVLIAGKIGGVFPVELTIGQG